MFNELNGEEGDIFSWWHNFCFSFFLSLYTLTRWFTSFLLLRFFGVCCCLMYVNFIACAPRSWHIVYPGRSLNVIILFECRNSFFKYRRIVKQKTPQNWIAHTSHTICMLYKSEPMLLLMMFFKNCFFFKYTWCTFFLKRTSDCYFSPKIICNIFFFTLRILFCFFVPIYFRWMQIYVHNIVVTSQE